MTDPTHPDFAAIIAEAQAGQAALARIEAIARAALGQAPHAIHAPPQIADDADLDSQWGNPSVFKDPPKWEGPSYAGAKFSDCPPDFLDTLAGFLAWRARKCDEEGKTAKNGQPQSVYLLRDAARARGWAVRARAKATAHRRPVATNPTGRGSMNDEDNDVPF